MKPILFNTEMVRAFLEGRKTVTRRVVKEPWYIRDEEASLISGLAVHKGTNETDGMPYYGNLYRTGEILYVRETFFEEEGYYIYKANCSGHEKFYRNGEKVSIKWRPSIHMPREAARLFLRVKEVRVERLQDIDDVQACEEGAEGDPCDCDGSEVFCSRCCNTGWITSPRSKFAGIWDSTIKPADLPAYGWAANPWVWVIEFERVSKEEAIK